MLIIISQMWKIHLMIVHSWFLTCLVFIKCAHTEKFVILWSSNKPTQWYTWRRAKDAAIYLYDYLLCIYKDCLLQWVFWGLIFFTLILYDIWNKGSSWSEEHLIISLKRNRKVKGASSFISSICYRHFLLYCVSVQLIEARDGSCSFTRLSVVKPKQKCRSL